MPLPYTPHTSTPCLYTHHVYSGDTSFLSAFPTEKEVSCPYPTPYTSTPNPYSPPPPHPAPTYHVAAISLLPPTEKEVPCPYPTPHPLPASPHTTTSP